MSRPRKQAKPKTEKGQEPRPAEAPDTAPEDQDAGRAVAEQTPAPPQAPATDDPVAEDPAIAVEPEPTVEETLRAERDEFQEKWLRVVAELDNVRKRARREVDDARRLAQADLLRSLLDVRDNFERALQSVQDSGDNQNSEKILAGLELIFQNLDGLLQERRVRQIEALGQAFDPAFHEAVGQLPREEAESGQVIEVVRSGFMFEDLVLRPVRVIIAS